MVDFPKVVDINGDTRDKDNRESMYTSNRIKRPSSEISSTVSLLFTSELEFSKSVSVPKNWVYVARAGNSV